MYLKQSKCQAVLKCLTNGTDYPSTNNNDASDIVQPSWLGKLNAKPLVNEEIAAAKFNRNAALLEAFTECLAYKSTTIHSLEDNAC